MLRSRVRAGTIHDGKWPRKAPPNAWFPSSGTARCRIRLSKIRWLCAFFLAAVLFFLVLLSSRRRARLVGHRRDHTGNQTSVDQSQDNASVNDTNTPPSTLKQTWKYPLVSREKMRKLERMEAFYAPEFYDLHAAVLPEPPRTTWPPRVTEVPERASRPQGKASTKTGSTPADICESPAHPRPCAFLLPLRVAEQESKARIHLVQIAQLARALNRTLVLPNVGKSKIGACFKWEFGAYYSKASLGQVLGGDADEEWFVELEQFRSWLGQEGRRGIKSQLVSVGATMPAQTAFRTKYVHSNADVSVLAYETFGTWERDLPGCFAGRFEELALETMPVYISVPNPTNKDGSVRPVGEAVAEAFSAISTHNASGESISAVGELTHPRSLPAAQVLVVNWDLRHPVFLPPRRQLEYSKRMHDLAAKYAPKEPYLVVQWRMETVNPELLEDCAHALVDTLSRLLHDTILATNITSVWLASDYPYPIVKHRPSQRRPALLAKSGTFKEFDVRHEGAVEILRSAFEKQGELNEWKLTDFAEVIGGEEGELLHDSGALAIIDKLVSTNAHLFLSGSSRCSRRSSFTKQVVDARIDEWSRTSVSHLRNVVEVFG